MLSRAKLNLRRSHFRQFSTALRNRIEDDGDWFYSPEWWGGSTESHTVFREVSDKGNGVVSVIAHPSSRPDRVYWGRAEDWLRKRYGEIYPGNERTNDFKVLGYQWRSLHFNDDTRQSVVKVMAAYRESDPGSIYLMQQAHCLAVPYVKSMISAGLSTISCSNFNLKNAILGKKKMNILCIGHGGGSIPLFLASHIQGAVVHIVEIDPLVVSASVQAMGFPSFSVMTPSGERAHRQPNPIDEVLWKGIHERLLLYELDAEEFILGDSNIYDIVFVDAYDGDDIFPHKLWNPNSPFLRELGNRLHPEHGTVVVNLHADSVDVEVSNPSALSTLPMGRYVSKVCKTYKNVLIGNGDSHDMKGFGVAFTVSVPWVCNTSFVVSKCSKDNLGVLDKDVILDALLSESLEVDNVLKLPFSCFQYIKRGFTLVS